MYHQSMCSSQMALDILIEGAQDRFASTSRSSALLKNPKQDTYTTIADRGLT